MRHFKSDQVFNIDSTLNSGLTIDLCFAFYSLFVYCTVFALYYLKYGPKFLPIFWTNERLFSSLRKQCWVAALYVKLLQLNARTPTTIMFQNIFDKYNFFTNVSYTGARVVNRFWKRSLNNGFWRTFLFWKKTTVFKNDPLVLNF